MLTGENGKEAGGESLKGEMIKVQTAE